MISKQILLIAVIASAILTTNAYAATENSGDTKDPKKDVTNNDASFDIKQFGLDKNGNPYLTVYGKAGITKPSQEGVFYAYVFNTDAGTYVVASHEIQDEHSGEGDGALDWHGHKVTLDSNNCIASISDEGKAVMKKGNVGIINTDALSVRSVLTAQLDEGSGGICVTSVFDKGDLTPNKNLNSGVLVYSHGHPGNPNHFIDTMAKMTSIENQLEKNLGIPTEKITHMPYTWDYGLMALDKSETDYSIFLYTDMFGPQSTVIHNVTRGMFGGIDAYEYCPGILYNANNLPPPAQDFSGVASIVSQYGPVCSYMGAITIPVEKFSQSKVIFAEPARPDHPILREIMVKQAKAASHDPSQEILVFVGHGAKADSNNNAQIKELTCAANYAKTKLGFADAFGVTVREDWPSLKPVAIANATAKIKTVLQTTGASHVVFVPVTGLGFHLLADALHAENIHVSMAPESNGKKEFTAWAQQTVDETLSFIKKQKPTASIVTPNWEKTYKCN